MTALTFSDLEHDPIWSKCNERCEPFYMLKSVAAERFGADTVLPEIARRLSCIASHRTFSVSVRSPRSAVVQ